MLEACWVLSHILIGSDNIFHVIFCFDMNLN